MSFNEARGRKAAARQRSPRSQSAIVGSKDGHLHRFIRCFLVGINALLEVALIFC